MSKGKQLKAGQMRWILAKTAWLALMVRTQALLRRNSSDLRKLLRVILLPHGNQLSCVLKVLTGKSQCWRRLRICFDELPFDQLHQRVDVPRSHELVPLTQWGMGAVDIAGREERRESRGEGIGEKGRGREACLGEMEQVGVENLDEEDGMLVGHLASVSYLERSLQTLEHTLAISIRRLALSAPEHVGGPGDSAALIWLLEEARTVLTHLGKEGLNLLLFEAAHVMQHRRGERHCRKLPNATRAAITSSAHCTHAGVHCTIQDHTHAPPLPTLPTPHHTLHF